eukprot:gene5185-biopygen5163
MHDAMAYSESTMDCLEDSEPPNQETQQELGERILNITSPFKGVCAHLSNRYTMIQLRASMESVGDCFWRYRGPAADRREVRKLRGGSKLVEHLGLEVDLKAGQLCVTPTRPQKIHQEPKVLFSEASRQRRWLAGPEASRIRGALPVSVSGCASGEIWAERKWHQHTVDRFVSALSAQLPRHYAYDPGFEGSWDFLAYSWLGEVNWVNPPWSLLNEVAHKLRKERTEAELLRACTDVVFTFVTFDRPDTGVFVLRTHISIAGKTTSVILHKEKGRGEASGSKGQRSYWKLPGSILLRLMPGCS